MMTIMVLMMTLMVLMMTMVVFMMTMLVNTKIIMDILVSLGSQRACNRTITMCGKCSRSRCVWLEVHVNSYLKVDGHVMVM